MIRSFLLSTLLSITAVAGLSMTPSNANAQPRRAVIAHEAEIQELKEKVGRLVEDKFGGDLLKAFGHYDENTDGKIDRDELIELLKDAGIGNWLTRGQWADGILAELDTDNDGAISAAELERGSK